MDRQCKKTTNNLHKDRQCKKTTNNLHKDRQCKKLHWSIYSAPDSAKKNKQQQQFTYGQTVQKSNSNLHMDRQCKKATAIYIWTVHIYRLYRRQCAKYTYIYSVHIVYYKDTLNYQRHIIHRMGTSTLCTVSIHNEITFRNSFRNSFRNYIQKYIQKLIQKMQAISSMSFKAHFSFHF